MPRLGSASAVAIVELAEGDGVGMRAPGSASAGGSWAVEAGGEEGAEGVDARGAAAGGISWLGPAAGARRTEAAEISRPPEVTRGEERMSPDPAAGSASDTCAVPAAGSFAAQTAWEVGSRGSLAADTGWDAGERDKERSGVAAGGTSGSEAGGAI